VRETRRFHHTVWGNPQGMSQWASFQDVDARGLGAWKKGRSNDMSFVYDLTATYRVHFRPSLGRVLKTVRVNFSTLSVLDGRYVSWPVNDSTAEFRSDSGTIRVEVQESFFEELNKVHKLARCTLRNELDTDDIVWQPSSEQAPDVIADDDVIPDDVDVLAAGEVALAAVNFDDVMAELIDNMM
jgi:hypothetical protein